jgi:outer membrane protein assembly factor BamB
MPSLPPDAFAERLRDLRGADLAAFCAAVWSARGWTTRIQSDGAVVAERDAERRVVASVPAGMRARLADLRSVSGDGSVPDDATAVVAPGRFSGDVPDGADVLDAEDLHGMVLYGLPRERADEILREHLGVPATVPPDFDETALDRALSALTAATAVPYVREAVAVGFVAALLLGVAMGLPPDAGGSPAETGSGSEAGVRSDGGTDGEPTTTASVGAGLGRPVSANWTTGLGDGPDAWPAFGGGPDRTAWRPGVSGPESPVSATFNRSFDSPIVSSPTVVEGTVYAGLYQGVLYAYGTTADGDLQVRWQLYFGDGITSSPAVDGDTVYVGTTGSGGPTADSFRERRNLYAVNATSGEVRWGYQIDSVAFSSPVVVDDTVYVGGADGRVHAVDAATGRARWQTALGDELYASPAVVDGTVYAAANGTIAALNASDGGDIWNRSVSTFVGSSPAVQDGRVYLGTERGTVLALDAATGATVWNASVNGTVYSSPAATADRVYVGTEEGILYALNASTGAVAWRRVAGDRVFSSPAVANGTVYVGVGGANGSVLALEAATGATEWRYDTVGPVTSSPAVVPGAVVIGDFSGHLYVLERNGSLSAVAREILEHREEACGDPACRDAFARALDNGTGGGGGSESEYEDENGTRTGERRPSTRPLSHSRVIASPASLER